ncbi:MAG: hypothetical protein HY709_11750, partial [Candidatus Latescibacteria bacterium]|nr:hypothetical protein [Candidatus Latescibacterota bacterium]
MAFRTLRRHALWILIFVPVTADTEFVKFPTVMTEFIAPGETTGTAVLRFATDEAITGTVTYVDT